MGKSSAWYEQRLQGEAKVQGEDEHVRQIGNRAVGRLSPIGRFLAARPAEPDRGQRQY